jgi:O-antigen ligase
MAKYLKNSALFVLYLGMGICLLTPILVDSSFFFPFIFTKVLVFRIAVEVLLLAYLVLNLISKEYRPRLGIVANLTGLFILVATISSLLGGRFYLSFWGDIERGEGLILWLHLWMFLIILTSVVKSKKAWLALLDFSLGISFLVSLFGLGQALKFSGVLASSGSRVDATFGNPAFFATYLLFHIAFASYLFFERHNRFLKAYYALLAFFFSWLVFATQTRGAVLGWILGILTAAILAAVIYRQNRRVRIFSISAGLALVIVAAGIFILKNEPFIKNSEILHRVTSMSLSERTAETRLATWKAASQGFKEKLLLGWGINNFEIVFNKYFPPIIYQREGSQVWFDRAHNMIFDRGVTTGVVGLVIFLALFLWPAYYLARHALRDPNKTKGAIIFLGFLAAYLFQNMFIFESIGIYIILFFFFAFLTGEYLPNNFKGSFSEKRYLWATLLVVYAVAFGPMIWKVNLKPAQVNIAAAQALRSDPQTEDFFVIVNRFKKVFSQDTYGRQEYRLQMIEFVDQQLANVGEVVPEVKPIVAYFDNEVEKQVSEDPTNAKNLLLAMRHYNYTFKVDGKTEKDRLNKALELFQRLEVLSPTRPQVPQEAAYSYLYLYRKAKDENEKKEVQDQYFGEAEKYFQEAIALNPQVVESYVNLIMLYLNGKATDKISAVVKEMDERGVNYRIQTHLSKLFNLAKSNRNYVWIAYFGEEVTKLYPDDVNAWIDVALAYAYSGNREKAIATAERIKQFGGEYVEQANEFLKNLDRGAFRTPPQ